LNPRVASAALALVTVATEEKSVVTSFSSGSNRYGYGRRGQGLDGISVLDISPKMRLTDVMAKVNNLPFGGTDVSLPMLWADKNAPETEAISVFTDSDTWSGTIHPSQALNKLRKNHGRDVRLATVAMTSNGYSIADPMDSGMMDFVGFDSSGPTLMSDFFRG